MITVPFNSGPWVTGDGEDAAVIYASDGTNRFEVATVAVRTTVVPDRKTSGNAKLIAASPAMFHAIQNLLLEGRSYSDVTWDELKKAWRAAGGL